MKILPENLRTEKENEDVHQSWTRNCESEGEYDLVSSKVIMEVKKTDFLDQVDFNMNNCSRNSEIKPSFGKRTRTVALFDRKELESPNKFKKFHDIESSADDKSFLLSKMLTIDCQEYHFDKILQEEISDEKLEFSTRDRAINNSPKIEESNDLLNRVTDPKYDDISNSYPVEFFNILPSVFKSAILYHANNLDEDNEVEGHRAEHESILKNRIHQKKPLSYRNTSELKPSSDKITYKLSLKNVCTTSASFKNNQITKLKNESEFPNQSIDLIGTKIQELKSKNENFSRAHDHPNRILWNKKVKSSNKTCHWADCEDSVLSESKLIEHLQTKHVYPQTSKGTFVCLWSGCKVFDRPSCSISFLERHILSHCGKKPFRCIVDNCGQRFSSQALLQRHVNQHFMAVKDSTDGLDDNQPKLVKRNRQKVKYRRHSVQNQNDTFDADTMSRLQYLLVQMVQKSKAISLNLVDSKQFLHITFQPKVIGSRRGNDGEIKYLVRWYPYNSLEDEWLSNSEIKTAKTVPIRELPVRVQQMFWNSIFPNKLSASVNQSFKRKLRSCKAT